jgi:hypothetical protein
MAEAAAKAGLVEFAHGGSVSLTGKGLDRGATLTPPGIARPRARAKRRPQ